MCTLLPKDVKCGYVREETLIRKTRLQWKYLFPLLMSNIANYSEGFPTHFTETSSTIIDLFPTAKKDSILLSDVSDPFLDQNVRYHCPIYCVLNSKFKPQYICSAQSGNRNNSGIVLRKTGILTLLRKDVSGVITFLNERNRNNKT